MTAVSLPEGKARRIAGTVPEGKVPVLISIVSHGHAALLPDVLGDIARHCPAGRVAVALTLNVPEELPESAGALPFPVFVIRNEKPLGYGANQNQAFRTLPSELFCVMNPDIRFERDPFPGLIRELEAGKAAVAAPLVLSPARDVEDSARRIITPWRLLRRVLRRGRGRRLEYPSGQASIRPDWVAGMFMLFESPVFASLGGFDDRYRLYLEDMEICIRIRNAGMEVLQVKDVAVIHAARRASHRNLRFLKWHLGSLAQFFLSGTFWRFRPRPAED